MLKNKVFIKKSLFYSLLLGLFILGLTTINSKLKLNSFINEYSIEIDYLKNRIDELESKYDDLNNELQSSRESIKEDDIIEEVEETIEDEEIANEIEVVAEKEIHNEEIEPVVIEETNDIIENNITEDTEIEKEEEIVNNDINLFNINSKSGLSEDQFNQLIELAMKNKNKSSSALFNMGAYLKFIEDEYIVNGLFALSVSSFESGWGVRYKNNNVFGFKSGALKFNNVGESINYFGELIRNNYMDKGRETVSSISTKYCPPNSDKWTSNVNWFMRYYADTANLILNPVE